MKNMMLVMLFLVACAVPAKAQFGVPVQTVYDSGVTYTLFSSGNITKSGGWGFGNQLIDNGTGTTMIAAGGGRLYVLKNNGNVWMYDGSFRMIDNGTGSSRIWVEFNTVFVQKNNGQVFQCVDPYSMQWQPANGGFRNFVRAANFEKLDPTK